MTPAALTAYARRRRLARARSCAAPTAADLAAEAMPRALRLPWEGGFVALARAVGVERIEAPAFHRLAPTCTAAAAAIATDFALAA